MNENVTPQPEPIPNKGNTPIWELVIKDMQDRDKFGRAKYGTPLQAGNGRDHIVDAYQEALDLAVYLRAEIEQRAMSPSRSGLNPSRSVRECLVKRRIIKGGKFVDSVEDRALFHDWGLDTYHDANGNMTNCSAAIVEFQNGEVRLVYPPYITFVS